MPQQPRSTSPDRDELAARAAAAEERTLRYWMDAVVSSANGSMTVKAMQQSMSWRVTRPMRAVGMVYYRSREAGVRKTFSMVQRRLAQLRQARKRG
jgi:hypothetical protein